MRQARVIHLQFAHIYGEGCVFQEIYFYFFGNDEKLAKKCV